MDPSQFPANSRRPQPEASEEKNVERIVVSEVVSRKKSIGKRLKETFIGGDSRGVLQYVIAEVLVPQAKDMISEMVTTAIEQTIYGERRSGRRFGSRSVPPKNYTQYAGRGNSPIGRATNREERMVNATVQDRRFDDIVLQTRVEADTVHERMYDLLQQYEVVTVADLHAMVGWSSSHVDHKWGWESLEGSNVQKVRGGYILNLAKPVHID